MSTVFIGDRAVGPEAPPFIVAEVGINHNGELERAYEMIAVAKDAGADAVKFQTFRAHELVGDPLLQFTYRSQGHSVTESMLAMFERYELPRPAWQLIRRACDAAGIAFLSTPQNVGDLEVLREVGVPAIKVGSDDFVNLPLLRTYAQTKLPLILSCGMSDLAEVHAALEAVGAFEGYPTILLLCTSQYPTPPGDVNIKKLDTLRSAFPMIVCGFSDHTQGALAAPLALAKGAAFFEKHFTLDHDLPGPDHWFSADPGELREWVHAIRNAHAMMGSAVVRPTAVERAQRGEFRRVIVAARAIAAGEAFTQENLAMRRVADSAALPPAWFDRLLGTVAARAYASGDPIRL